STSKTPSYTKSVSWQHHPRSNKKSNRISLYNLTLSKMNPMEASCFLSIFLSKTQRSMLL
ncbi:hypothetical protein, partial [Escherichia coli]|uniref:hypothetical protein n=1 Tax=Escherichia coli TaxID=562 RepID=UPI00215049D2